MNILSTVHHETPFFQNLSTLSNSIRQPLVLIAENDAAARGALKTLTADYGVKTLETENGEQAVNYVVYERPDLILINTDLPQISGYEAARLIRTIKSFDSTPIIFISDRTQRKYRKRAFTIGGNAFHLQPLNAERLQNILERFLMRENVAPALSSRKILIDEF